MTPTTKQFTGDSPVAFVIAASLRRRDLTASQKACIAVEIEPMFVEEARKRREATRAKPGEAADKRGGNPATALPALPSPLPPSPRSNPYTQTPAQASTTPPALPQSASGPTPPTAEPAPPAPQARDLAAKTAGTSGRYVRDAKVLRAAAPGDDVVTSG